MSHTVRSLILAAALTAGITVAGAAQQYIVIANAAVPTGALQKTELTRVYERTAIRWPNGLLVEPVDQADGAALRERFTQDLFHRNTTQMKAYWQSQIFNGRTVPPIVLNSEPEVIAFVQTHAGAIAYVSTGAALPQGVKRLDIAR